MRQCPAGRVVCERFRAKLLARVQRSLAPQRLRCPFGLTEIAVPVLANSHHIATLVGYRVCDCPPSSSAILRFARRFGLDSQKMLLCRLRAAYRRVPVIPAEIQRSHLLLLQMLALQLGELTRRALQGNFRQDPLCIRRAKEFIESHLAEPLTVGVVAAQACLCPQQFCKRFKQVSGATFHEYLVVRRVERAKESLCDLDQKVLAVALASGFQSPATFYRTFKKHTGHSPARYRAVSCDVVREPAPL